MIWRGCQRRLKPVNPQIKIEGKNPAAKAMPISKAPCEKEETKRLFVGPAGKLLTHDSFNRVQEK